MIFINKNINTRTWILVFAFLVSSITSATYAATGVTLNLKDADIQSFIETVAEISGKNFVVDPRVNAKVTVISARPMDRDEIYQVFLSVLQVHGFATVEVGEVIKILPDVNAKQGPGGVVTGNNSAKGDELVTRVIQIENVAAAQLVPILRPLVPQQGHLAAYPGSNVLVISDRGANIVRLEKIINKIDRPDEQEIEVIPLDHASASEVVQIINSLRANNAGQGGQTPGGPILASDERTNSILLSGDPKARVKVRGLIAHLDTPVEGTGNTRVVYLHYSQAEEIAPILQGITEFENGEGTTANNNNNQDVNIQADPTNNALVITAPPARFESLRRVINQLDVRRAQVLVESIIAEVSTDLTRELGVEGFLVPTNADDGSQPAISSVNSGSLLGLIQDPFSIGNGLSLGAADLTGSTQWGVLLRALEGDASTNILSTPTLVTLDNEEAEIIVAENVPFITGSFTATGGSDSAVNPFQTIERQDVGITLRLTPQINEGNSIRLDLEQESSSISTSSVASDIITNERRIVTSVLVDDGEILVLGGLTEDTFTDSVVKVPLLGDIPLLGNLFKSTTTSKAKSNLMVFIHPVILRDAGAAALATGSKYEFLRARQLESGIHDRGIIKDNVSKFPDLIDLTTQIPKTGNTQTNADRLIPQAPTSP